MRFPCNSDAHGVRLYSGTTFEERWPACLPRSEVSFGRGVVRRLNLGETKKPCGMFVRRPAADMRCAGPRGRKGRAGRRSFRRALLQKIGCALVVVLNASCDLRKHAFRHEYRASYPSASELAFSCGYPEEAVDLWHGRGSGRAAGFLRACASAIFGCALLSHIHVYSSRMGIR